MTIEVGKSGGGLPKLAPDLSYLSNLTSSHHPWTEVIINPVGALTTALNLTGKFMLISMGFSGVDAETVTVKMTKDGVVIINDTFTCSGSGIVVINSVNGFTHAGGLIPLGGMPFVCDSSFLLQIQTTSDSAVTFRYNVRPIL